MHVIYILSFTFNLGIYGSILPILYLLLRNLAPRLFALLDEAEKLCRAEELGSVTSQSG
jgi:hypothetical protein